MSWRPLKIAPVFLSLAFFLVFHAVAAEDNQIKARHLPEIGVSVPRGYCEQPFLLKLDSPVSGAIIRYTLEGSDPSLAGGQEYREPLVISNTTPFRAAAFREGVRVSSITSCSYIFLDQVIHQGSKPAGFPAGPRAWRGEPSVYEMSPRVVNDPLYRGRIKESLQALPILSIVFRQADLFSVRTGIYLNSLQRGETWERPCSVEFIPAEGSAGFQIDCGIRIQGNYNRIPVKSPKHSFRLLFKEKYGPSKLNYPMFADSTVRKFDTLVLRADYNNSWVHWDSSGQVRGQRIRDAWMKDSQRDMGWVSGHNRYLHLYLNGVYWGVYDAAERPDASFAAAYFGGSRKDYDIVNENQVKGGNIQRFSHMQAIGDFSGNAPFRKLRQELDITEYIDYLLLNYYAGNHDWGEYKNWYAIGQREPPEPFQYFVWDGEFVLQRLQDDVVNSPFEVPFNLAEGLRANPEFRLAFADRAQKHLFGEGALTPAAVRARWMKRAAELDKAIIAESARWGGFRRDPPYTRDREWLAEQRRLMENYFPRRTAVVLEQLRMAGLYPNVAAPVFNLAAANAGSGRKLSIGSVDGDIIYYTTNGLDPRVPVTDAISPHAVVFKKTLEVPFGMQVKARTLKSGQWSALAETANQPP